MFKSVIKEIIIMLLLCIAIVLILGVIFYNYIPNNKAIPNKLAAYSTPENVKSEIDEQISENEKEEITYRIDAADLKLYKSTNGYTTGKSNPFSEISNIENVDNTENNETKNNTNNSVDKNSTGTFYENKNTK